MVSSEHGAVVVGVDGSPESLVAVDLAAREAALRGRALRVVHGYSPGYVYFPPGVLPGGSFEEEMRRQADRIVAGAVARARDADHTITVTGEVIDASGAQVLITCSRSASLVVVGDRGLNAFTGLLLGSVAIQVTAHATAPVLVVRGTSDPMLPVLLAADGSPANDPAVGFAFEEAALRGAALVAMHVWSQPAPIGPGDVQPLVYDENLVVDEEERVLAEALAGWHGKYPDVEVHRQIMHGGIRRTIIDATRYAQLVVVGARGHGGFAGLLLGSVSQAVLHHSACPTVVVPHPHGR